MNILDYLKKNPNERINFNNELDALCLTLSSYYDFETLNLKFEDPINVSKLPIEKVEAKVRRNHQYLLELMMESKKFENLKILDFQYNFDTLNEEQFAAITYLINDKDMFIAYRGTDSTVVGWKEDLNMSFSEVVPSHISGINYLNRIMATYDYDVYLGGHSKGGNVAVYSPAFCESYFQDRILKVYNFDGPGFHSRIAQDPRYASMLNRTYKYIPEASIVGQLMNALEQEIIVKSNQISLFQHDAYTWQIEDGKFIRVSELSRPAQHFSQSLQDWLEEITDEQRKYVIDELYLAFKTLNIDSFEDVWEFLSLSTLKGVKELFDNADPEFKEYLNLIMKQFFSNLVDIRKKQNAINEINNDFKK